MKIYRPRKIGKLIISKTYIKGPKGGTNLNLMVDTGSTYTVIEAEILKQIGCNPATSKDTRQIITANGRVTVPWVQIAQINCFGQFLENYHVLAHVFPIEVYFDGLLGMDFLERFPLEIKPYSGEVVVRNI